MRTVDVNPIRIVIADDHKIFREGFKLIIQRLKSDGIVLVGEAANGAELIDVVEKVKPDVVVTDIKMPVMDGIEASTFLKKKNKELKIIALSNYNDEQLVTDMIEVDGNGYLLKDTSKEELLKAIKTVYKGGFYFSPETTVHMAKEVNKGRKEKKEPIAKLTEREKEVLDLICKEYCNKEIADMLNISPRSVESHRRNIMDKTGSKNSIGMVVYAMKHELIK